MKSKKFEIKVNYISYDQELDILELHSNSPIDHSKNVGGLVIIHFDKKDKVVGLEFMGLAKVQGIPKKNLMNINSAFINLVVYPQEKSLFITANILSVIDHKQIPGLITAPPLIIN